MDTNIKDTDEYRIGFADGAEKAGRLMCIRLVDLLMDCDLEMSGWDLVEAFKDSLPIEIDIDK